MVMAMTMTIFLLMPMPMPCIQLWRDISGVQPCGYGSYIIHTAITIMVMTAPLLMVLDGLIIEQEHISLDLDQVFLKLSQALKLILDQFFHSGVLCTKFSTWRFVRLILLSLGRVLLRSDPRVVLVYQLDLRIRDA